MKKSDLMFGAGIVVVGVGLYVLSVTTGRHPPEIPPDMKHISAKTNAECMVCHAQGKESPLKVGHPPKEQCLECHKFKASGHGVMR